MDTNNFYVFYNSEKAVVGKLLMRYKDGYVIEMQDNKIEFIENCFDKVNEETTVPNFIEYTSKVFQNKFRRNVSIKEDDYLFNISIPRYYAEDTINLNEVEETINNVLEDWWSVQWCELNFNSIVCRLNSVELYFRVHDVHEAEFRFNDLLLDEE